jgi:hypothetical protein
MSDVATRFHENWLGLVQPIEGLVVSVPVLVDAECMERQPPRVQGNERGDPDRNHGAEPRSSNAGQG